MSLASRPVCCGLRSGYMATRFRPAARRVKCPERVACHERIF
jgi:hypothetical protein